jgi:hypothetical protein
MTRSATVAQAPADARSKARSRAFGAIVESTEAGLELNNSYILRGVREPPSWWTVWFPNNEASITRPPVVSTTFLIESRMMLIGQVVRVALPKFNRTKQCTADATALN